VISKAWPDPASRTSVSGAATDRSEVASEDPPSFVARSVTAYFPGSE
jgi:hypothetical protein